MIFVGLFVIMTLLCVATNNGKYRNGRLFVCAVIGMYLLCLMGLRHINYGGVDTQVYARDFTRIVVENYTFADIFENFYKDYGFYLFAKIVSLFTSNANCWIFICAMPYIFAVIYIIYKYSDDVFLSFVMFISFGFYLYDFQLMRHVFSLTFVIFALEGLQKGCKKRFFVLSIIASLFHAFAAIILLTYFIRKARLGIKQIAWMCGGALVLVIFIQQRSQIVKIMSNIQFLNAFSRLMNYVEDSSVGTISNFLIQMMFVVFVWFFMEMYKGNLNYSYKNPKSKKENKLQIYSKGIVTISKNHRYITSPINYDFLFNLAVIGAVFYLGQMVVGECYRIAQYFSIYIIILVPNILNMIKDRRIKWIIYAVIVIFALRHFFGGVFLEGSVYNPYQFFWESTQSLY